MKNAKEKKTCKKNKMPKKNNTVTTTKIITGLFRYILIVIWYEEISILINMVMLFIYSKVMKYEIFFAAFFVISCIAALLLGICHAYKQNKNHEKTILSQVISVYDEAKDELEKYCNVENEILSHRSELEKDSARQNEIKVAYILKAVIAREMGAVETLSILSIMETLLLSVIESSTMKVVCASVLLVLTVIIAAIAIILVPREKYIESVCEKIIQEAKK